MTYADAAASALRAAMARDSRVVVLGEDVGRGGIFQQYKGLQAEFGGQRVIDTPISESTIAGAGVGMALAGLRPVVELRRHRLRALRHGRDRQSGREEPLHVRRTGACAARAAHADRALGQRRRATFAEPRSVVRPFAGRRGDVPGHAAGQPRHAHTGARRRRPCHLHGTQGVVGPERHGG